MTVLENLENNAISPEEFVVSIDRLLDAAVVQGGDLSLANDIVERTQRLAGVGRQAALGFVLGRVSKKLDKAIREAERVG